MPKKQQQQTLRCMKCKQQTQTLNPRILQTKNGRHRLAGTCSVCGTSQSQFISAQHAEGLLGKLFGAPGGKIPLLGDLPLIGALF